MRFQPCRIHLLKVIYVKNDSLEPLVMLVEFFPEISGVLKHTQNTSPSYGLDRQMSTPICNCSTIRDVNRFMRVELTAVVVSSPAERR